MISATASALEDLARELSGDVLTDDFSRAMYSTAAGIYQVAPQGIIRPRSRDDIVKALAWARGNGVPVTLRGGGTSAVDGCLGSGLIIDTSTYLGPETGIDVHDSVVTAPAGVAYAKLNEVLARFGRHLPPDPTTGAYATIGGLIATNAAGVSSIKYGSIIDYVASLELVFADGTVHTTAPVDVRESSFKELISGEGTVARIYAGLYNILRERRALIEAKTPEVPANASGYRLERGLRRGLLDLAQVVTGSEGTLAVITRATLHTVERPPMAGIILLYFENVQLAADSVRPILEARPVSLEMIDGRALDLIRSSRPDLAHFLREKTQSVLLVEFDGADNDEIIPKLVETQRLIADEGGTASDSLLITAEPDIEEAHALRTAAHNTLHNIKGPRRVTPFIEDIAVGPDMVSSCIHGLSEIMKKRGLDVAINGHAGQGSFSARPLLDLKNADDVKLMREVAEEVFTMVVDMGGTLSAGHGDGLARTEFLRLQYGELCDVFAEVKRLFDPDGLLNPGIKVGAERGTIVSNLRYGPGYAHRSSEPKLLYPDEPREELIEKCHGCGACRTKTDALVMCPAYKALQTEEASPRAKANVLRHLLSSRGTLPPEDEVVAEMTRLTDLCLGCKMCSVECPTGIDVAKLMIELRARRAEKTGPARDERAARLWAGVLPYLATVPPVGNFLCRNTLVRRAGQALFGLAAKRQWPRLRPLELRSRHKPTLTRVRQRVALFTDTLVDCTKPEVLHCALKVLLHNGTEVEIVSGHDSGAERMMCGNIKGARRAIERNVRRLAPLVADGYRVVFPEPRATLFFRRGILDCVDSPEARAVAAASFDLMQFLLSIHRAGQLDLRFRALPIPLAYHAPCHLRALQIGKPSYELLRLIPELPVVDLSAGCCGMAGTFGLREKNYDLSLLIGRHVFDQVRHLEVRYGLTECSACAMQLEQGSGKRVLHPIQVLHRAYGLEEAGFKRW